MATPSKNTRSSSRAAPRKTGSQTKTAAATRQASRSTRQAPRSTARRTASPRRQAPPPTQPTGPDRGTIAKSLLGAVAGTAAVGLAGRAAMRRARRPSVLGVTLPRELDPRHLDLRKLDLKKLDLKKLDMKKLSKQIGDLAERLERTSEDVRMVSAQAKRVSRKIG